MSVGVQKRKKEKGNCETKKRLADQENIQKKGGLGVWVGKRENLRYNTRMAFTKQTPMKKKKCEHRVVFKKRKNFGKIPKVWGFGVLCWVYFVLCVFCFVFWVFVFWFFFCFGFLQFVFCLAPPQRGKESKTTGGPPRVFLEWWFI